MNSWETVEINWVNGNIALSTSGSTDGPTPFDGKQHLNKLNFIKQFWSMKCNILSMVLFLQGANITLKETNIHF